MKYRIFGILMILSILVSGCIFDDTFKADPDIEDVAGILMEDDGSGTGTHYLITGVDADIPVRSLTFNLTDDQYLGNEVQLMGSYNEEDGVFEATGITLLRVMTPPESSEANFITFRDTDFGVEFKYYDSWDLTQGADIELEAPAEDGDRADTISITQGQFTYADSLDDEGDQMTPLGAYLEENFPELSDEDVTRKIGPDNLDAIEIAFDAKEIDYFLYRNGLIYNISFRDNGLISEEHGREFNELVSEFRFIGFTVEDAIVDNANPDGIKDDVESEEETGEEPEEEPDEVVTGILPDTNLNLTTFESLPYSFRADYPASWYYSGERGQEPGVLHHYGFSDEEIDEDNEILSLDVISDSIPSGSSVNYGGPDIVTTSSGGEFAAYLELDGQNYKVSGDKEYEDLILNMAASISKVEREEE